VGQLGERCGDSLAPESVDGEFVVSSAAVQNLRRGHYELAVDVQTSLRVAEAFIELALAV
jgi:transposase, IS6 family